MIGMRNERTPRTFLKRTFQILGLLLVVIVLASLSFLVPFFSSVHPDSPSTQQQAPVILSQQSSLSATEVYQQVLNREPTYTSIMAGKDMAKWGEWQSDLGQACHYHDDAYFADTPQGYTFCQSRVLTVTDFAIQIEFRILSADSRGGLLYRSKITDGHWLEGYWVQVDTNGSYWMQTKASVLKGGSTNKWQQGVGEKNTLMLIVQGSRSLLFLDGNYVTELDDGAFQQGSLALTTMGTKSAASIQYQNIQLWNL